MKENRTIILVLAALFLFAVGFIGFSLFQDNQFQEARNAPVPSLPPAN